MRTTRFVIALLALLLPAVPGRTAPAGERPRAATAPAKGGTAAPAGKLIPITPGRGPRVSLDVRGIDIRTVLEALADSARVRFTIAPGVQGTVSHNQRDLALEDMLDAILPPLGLRWTRSGAGHYRVEPAVEAGTGRSLLRAPRGWAAPGLAAVYFNDRACELPDRSLSALPALLPGGAAAIRRVEPGIAFTWQRSGPAPGIGPAHWSARWRGRLWVPVDDVYTFSFTPRGGAALLLLDGKLVVDDWQPIPNPASLRGQPVKLTRGWHDTVVEYHQLAAAGALFLRWQAAWLPREAVPLYDAHTGKQP